MNTRITIGKGVTGCVRYCQGEGRHPVTGELLPPRPDGGSRVDWIGGTGFSFAINTKADAERARILMEIDAQNQPPRKGGRRCEKDCVHLVLAWRPGDRPSREEMEAAAKEALDALGMGNAKALFFAHNDEDYFHLHCVASKINPTTGRAYDLRGNYLILSRWAEQYEREHGGVINLRRADMNELRAAIKDRDALAVLEAMTRQRSTVTDNQLERALQKEIQAPRGASEEQKQAIAVERERFQAEILAHPEAVRLEETRGAAPTRFTTKTVLEAELHVTRAGDELAASIEHDIGEKSRAAILQSPKFAPGIEPVTGEKKGLTPEQIHAFRHTTAAEGIALIDGQAGTGKSYTISAIREGYEAAGYRVIGLAPTNAVAEDMRADGFKVAKTAHSELTALANDRSTWTHKTAVIVDEAAMLDTAIMALVTAWAAEAGAKLILVGDDRQLSSISRGGMYGALKDRFGAAALSEVKRQYKIDERRASEMMASGNFHDALGIYNQKGAIHWTRTQPEARAALITQWAKDSAEQPDKTRFVFAYTNDAVQQLNSALRAVRHARGELGIEKRFDTAHGRYDFAEGDRIQFTGTDKQAGIYNGHAGTIAAIDGTHLAVKLDGRKPKTINFDAAGFDQFRHGYAGTIYRGQGKTLDATYLYHSEHWRSAPSYVALTRHREKTELYVARNTAHDVTELARQMARTDDRRAASQFHTLQEIAPVPILTAAELSAKLAPMMARRERQHEQELEAARQQEREVQQDNERPAQILARAAGDAVADYHDLPREIDDDRHRTRSR
jgi:ATP-dependent exoDNAse (exonuclease V) alpha subunit